MISDTGGVNCEQASDHLVKKHRCGFMGAAQVICNHLAFYLHEQNMMIVDTLFFTRRDFAPLFFFPLWTITDEQSEPSCDFSGVFCAMTAFCLWLSITHQPACREKQEADWMPACEMFASGNISTPFSQDRRSISTFFFFSDSLELWFVLEMIFFSSPPSSSSSPLLLISSSLLGCRFPACLPKDRRRKPNPPEPNVAQITKQSCIYLLSFHSAFCACDIELHSHTQKKKGGRRECVCVCVFDSFFHLFAVEKRHHRN